MFSRALADNVALTEALIAVYICQCFFYIYLSFRQEREAVQLEGAIIVSALMHVLEGNIAGTYDLESK